MEKYTKEQVMELKPQELADYINHMFNNGWSLNKLNKEKGIRRQTVREKLKRAGYVLNADTNRYELNEENNEGSFEGYFINSQIKKEKAPKITIEELQKRVEALEMRLNSMEKAPSKAGDVEVIKFNSKTHDRNYPLHKEVVDLLDELRTANKHLKIKDLVNTGLYIGLSKMKDSDNIE
ncbi:MAG: hypothetical protein J6D33_06600 [Turicibacter sp.]|nr:hypothetical protein [Turicibacter sp.]